MKRILLFFCLISAGQYCLADNMADYKRGNELYAAGKFAAAIEAYQKAVQSVESQEIYYNLGNAYYKNGQIGKAILHYEKALGVNPEFVQARENLEIANAHILDKVEPDSRRKFSTIWVQFIKDVGLQTFSIISLLFCFLGGLLLALFIASKQKHLKKLGFFGGMFCLFVSILALYLSFNTLFAYTDDDTGIITVQEIQVKSAPTEGGTDLFILHEGTKIKVNKTEGSWAEISISSGNTGWVKMGTFEKI